MHYEAKTPQIYHRLALFDPSLLGNFMIPVVTSAFFLCFILQAMPGTNAQVRDQHSFMASWTTCGGCDKQKGCCKEAFHAYTLGVAPSQ